MSCRALLAMVLMTWFVAGCGGSGQRRVAVEGQVRQGGQPLASGTVTFLPAKGVEGPAANANISQGRYRFASDDGPVPGQHEVLVQVVAGSKDAFLNDPAAAKRQTGQAADGKDTWTFNVDVPDQRSFTYDIDLQ